MFAISSPDEFLFFVCSIYVCSCSTRSFSSPSFFSPADSSPANSAIPPTHPMHCFLYLLYIKYFFILSDGYFCVLSIWLPPKCMKLIYSGLSSKVNLVLCTPVTLIIQERNWLPEKWRIRYGYKLATLKDKTLLSGLRLIYHITSHHMFYSGFFVSPLLMFYCSSKEACFQCLSRILWPAPLVIDKAFGI